MSAMKPTRKDATSSPASSHLDPPVPTGSWPVSGCRRAPPGAGRRHLADRAYPRRDHRRQAGSGATGRMRAGLQLVRSL